MLYNDAQENAEIEAGNVLEVAITVGFSSAVLSNAQRIQEIQDAKFTTC